MTIKLTKTQLKVLKGLVNKISTNNNGNKDYHSLYCEFSPKAPDVLSTINKKLQNYERK